MKNQNPKKDMELLETVLNAWKKGAPSVKFGGISLAEYEALVDVSQQDRLDRIEVENARTEVIVKRETDDATALLVREKVVLAVAGDPNFGLDSALYEMMGYKRKSDYKSGLTRKKKNSLTDDKELEG